MWFHLLATALLLHTYFWGAGLAGLVLPRRWRRWWWVFAPGLGLALQSAVVWTGAHANLPGTNSYARGSEVLPALLLVLAWHRGRDLRRAAAGLRGAVGAGVLMAAAGWLLVSPMTATTGTPTTLSLGSCDAADYAAGARVLQEFARDDRTGFLGEPEVTHVRSVDYFFEFWLRLNHFTPSAILAHAGAILRERPHALAGLLGAVLVVLNLPAALFLARLALGLRGAALLALTGVLAFSPLQAYAVYQVALGQLFAVQGILLVTIAVVAAVRLGRPWAVAPLAFAGFWTLAGGYNMLLPVCLAPAGCWLLADAWWRRDERGAVRTGLMLAVTLALCAGMFWDRFAGLAERFSLLHQYDFGWPVPGLTPEGWLGLVRGPALAAWPGGIRALALGLVAAGWLGAIVMSWRHRRPVALVALAFVVPVAAGWGILAWETRVRANASYDAYKLIAAFQPELILGLGCGLAAVAGGSIRRRRAAGLALAAVLAGNLAALGEFRREVAHAALRVDRPILALGRLEDDPRIASVNIRVDEFWPRLWANALLLRKPQYFATHSYEGRLNTALKGQWDLSDSPVCAVPFAGEDYIVVNERFHLVRAGAAGRIESVFGPGWHLPESGSLDRWRWTSGDAEIHLVNPAASALRVRVTVRAHALTPRALQLRANGTDLGARPLGVAVQTVDFGELELPPGRTVLTLHSDVPAASPGGGDERRLSIALHELTLRALPPR